MADLTTVLDDAGVEYELLSHEHTERAARSVDLPTDRDRAVDLWERQGRGLHLDGVAFLPGEPAPRLDRDDGAGPTPRAGKGARPDTGRPEGGAMPRIRDEELSIHTLEQVERVAAWKEPCRGRRASRRTEHRLVGGEDERFSD